MRDRIRPVSREREQKDERSMVKTSAAESKRGAAPVAVRRPDPRDSSKPQAATEDSLPRRHSGTALMLGFIALAAVLVLVAIGAGVFERGPVEPESPSIGAIPAAYNRERAFGYLQQLCDLGPRPSGSAAMARQQQMLQQFFADRGASVTMQTFDIRHPEDGSDVALANLIASWHPDRPKRFLLCAHYDTRPFPDQDPLNRRGTFVGANDGASGTAALMELANQMSDLPQDVGVDIVLFDGEEFVWQQGRDDYFLGSTFFARKYLASPPAVPYQAGILLDMIGDRELTIYYEQNSLRYARDVVKSIWRTADKLGVRAFVPRVRHTIDDDHIPLNKIARIPTVDLIDFDYPRVGIGAPSYWHTEQDIPDNCSGDSLAAVVWVLHQWLKGQ
jgi:hypothetical protein